jgi:hypothetical protein
MINGKPNIEITIRGNCSVNKVDIANMIKDALNQFGKVDIKINGYGGVEFDGMTCDESVLIKVMESKEDKEYMSRENIKQRYCEERKKWKIDKTR